jgi:hypothetical protein
LLISAIIFAIDISLFRIDAAITLVDISFAMPADSLMPFRPPLFHAIDMPLYWRLKDAIIITPPYALRRRCTEYFMSFLSTHYAAAAAADSCRFDTSFRLLSMLIAFSALLRFTSCWPPFHFDTLA